MRCYPIKKEFVRMFIDKEDVLLELLKRDSMQLNKIVERIDICDFSMRCIRFYKSHEYVLKNNTLIYTSDITKKKCYASLHSKYISFSCIQGFESFLERYFPTCFLCEDDFLEGKWFSFMEK